MYTKDSQNFNKGEHTGEQVEDCLQANGEREIDTGVNLIHVGAPGATLGLVRRESVRDFLERM